MATAPIGRPKLFKSVGTSSPGLTRPQKSDGGNTFVAGALVVLDGSTLKAATSSQTAIWGLTPDASHTATDEPYSAPFGENHNAIDPTGQLFVMNVTLENGTVGSGATTLNDVVIGKFYPGALMNTGDTLSMGLASNTGVLTASASNIFQVVDKLDAATYVGYDAATDYNGRVVVKVAAVGIQ